jgi:hypothetical protein
VSDEHGDLEVGLSRSALLRLAGSLLVGGILLNVVVEAFHPSTEDLNDHARVFAEYARSDAWQAIHLGQFAAGLIAIAGFVVLYVALQAIKPSMLARLALASAIATAAAFAVLQAIDGVGLKQAVDSWAGAAPPQKAAYFHDAETVRWLEWGANSYFRILNGVTLLLFSVAIIRTALVSAWVGWIGGLAGAAFIALGVIVGYDGFTGHGVGAVAGVALLIFAIGITVVGWRTKDVAKPAGTG